MTDQKNDLQAIAEQAHAALEARGIQIEPQMAPEGLLFIEKNGRFVLNVNNIVFACMEAGADQWQPMLDAWAARIEAEAKVADQYRDISPTQLKSLIRTRLLPDDADLDFGYGKKIAPGLNLVLSIDTPTMVQTLTPASLKLMPFTPEELYEFGQANTDNEALETELIAEPVWAAKGDSWYIAGKLGNIPKLAADLGVDISQGFVFVPLARDTILFLKQLKTGAPAVGDLITMTQIADSMYDPENPELAHKQISPLVFQWSPDGTIEIVAGPRILAFGEDTTLVAPLQ